MYYNGQFLNYTAKVTLEDVRNRTICVSTPEGIRNMKEHDDYTKDLVLIDQAIPIIDPRLLDVEYDVQIKMLEDYDRDVIKKGEYCRVIPITITPKGIWA